MPIMSGTTADKPGVAVPVRVNAAGQLQIGDEGGQQDDLLAQVLIELRKLRFGLEAYLQTEFTDPEG